MRDSEISRHWLMLAAASLAGGAAAKQAVENADAVVRGFKSRYPEDEDERD